MLGAWQIYEIYFPPALIAIFLGISVASLLYRFLGGIHNATFAIGALKVTGSAAVLAGIAWWSDTQLNKQIEVYNTQKDKFSELSSLRSKLEERNGKIVEFENRISDLNKDKENLTREASFLREEIEKIRGGKELSEFIEVLDPEDGLSEKIREIQFNKKGPWSPFSKSIAMKASVVHHLNEGEFASCWEYNNKTIEIVSDYSLSGELIRAISPITVKVNKYITRARDCSNKYSYQLQINCVDASKIFTSRVLECGSNNEVKWKVDDRLLPINAIIVTNQDDSA